mmetsp:Transcript_86766/g.265583  ORF Transcript_86766/g.265583 Transcript_86766/m.265583 type:complete len:209 (-) Transcript_86766:773-1399(-)
MRRHGAADPFDARSRRCAGLLHRAAGDRGGHRSDRLQNPGPRHLHGRVARAADLRDTADRNAGEDLRAHARGRPEGGAGHEHRGDVHHDRQHRVRYRPRLLQAEYLQSAHWHGISRGRPVLEGLSKPTSWPRRASEAREVFPLVHQVVVRARARRRQCARDPALESGPCRPHAQVNRHRRLVALRFHGPAASRDSDQGPRTVVRPQRT